jgi:hypothetical protein
VVSLESSNVTEEDDVELESGTDEDRIRDPN